MTTPTTYQGYAIPDIGQEDWGDEIIDAWEALDSDVKGLSETTINKSEGTFSTLSSDSADIANSANIGQVISDDVQTSQGEDYATENYADTGTVDGSAIAPSSVDTDVLNAEHFGTADRSAHVICRVDSDFNKHAYGPNGKIESGATADTVIQAGIDWLHNNGYGDLIIHDRMVVEGSQLTLKNGVKLHCSRSGELVNQLGTDTPVMHVNPGGHIGNLKVNCEGGPGITIGSANTYVGCDIDRARIYNCGTNSTSYTALDFQGYALHINKFESDGNFGYTALELSNSADVFINQANPVNSQQALRASNAGQIFITNFDADTGAGIAVELDDVQDLHLSGTVWHNSSGNSESWSNAVVVGGNSTAVSNNLFLDIDCMRPGPTGIELNNIEASHITALITNDTGGASSPSAMSTGLVYGSGVGDDTVVTATIDIADTATDISGTPSGVLNGTGYEAAGSGTAPTAANWTEHRTVENTDDSTIWIKARSGSMVQLA